jgi:hypothetical protein
VGHREDVMPVLTRDDVRYWGKLELLRVLPYANAFRNTTLDQLREMAWLEIQKQQIEEADNAKKQFSVA